MLFCFTGTGNSRYIANRIADITEDTVVNIHDKIKAHDTAPIKTDGKLIFVTPTYAWRIPKVVETWIRSVDFGSACKAWFVMSCGGQIGNSAQYNAKICADKGWDDMGTMPIVMPDNYIILFDAPDKDEAKAIVAKADPVIAETADLLKAGKPFPKVKTGLYDRLMSAAVNPAFNRFHLKANAFRAGEACVGCGQCATLCPLNNIRLENGRPTWGRDCTHCMACINRCPTEAIEYGKKTVGKPRYHID